MSPDDLARLAARVAAVAAMVEDERPEEEEPCHPFEPVASLLAPVGGSGGRCLVLDDPAGDPTYPLDRVLADWQADFKRWQESIKGMSRAEWEKP